MTNDKANNLTKQHKVGLIFHYRSQTNFIEGQNYGNPLRFDIIRMKEAYVLRNTSYRLVQPAPTERTDTPLPLFHVASAVAAYL